MLLSIAHFMTNYGEKRAIPDTLMSIYPSVCLMWLHKNYYVSKKDNVFDKNRWKALKSMTQIAHTTIFVIFKILLYSNFHQYYHLYCSLIQLRVSIESIKFIYTHNRLLFEWNKNNNILNPVYASDYVYILNKVSIKAKYFSHNIDFIRFIYPSIFYFILFSWSASMEACRFCMGYVYINKHP